MSELSKSDRELMKLRGAKMSTKTIAMLMGGRWTEAKVSKRLAEIDGQGEAAGPDLPLVRRIDEDLPEEPEGLPAHIAEALESRSTPFPGDPKVVVVSNADLSMQRATWMASAVNYLDPNPAFRPNAVFIGGASVGKARLAVAWPAAVAEQVVAAPMALFVEELTDAYPSSDQPAVAAAAPDPEPDGAPAQAGPERSAQTQVDGDQAPEAAEPEEELSRAPNPLSTEARPFVPVHQVRRRKALARVAAPAPNLLASAPPPPARRIERGQALRLRPLTDKITGYAARFLAANWPIDEIAHLFDVSPDALEKVLT